MKSLLILVFSFMVLFLHAQDDTPYDFLTIVIDNPKEEKSQDQVFYYPEGSHYKVYLQKKNEEPQKAEGVITYDGDMKLRVYPQYRKESPDEIKINNRRLRIFTSAKAAYSAGFGAEWYNASKQNNSHQSEGCGYNSHTDVTVNKEITWSEKLNGKYNLKLAFSNGITFTYNNGEYKASLENKDLQVKSKYIIESKLGTTKFSFNENNGEVWWIFEPKEN